jgi:hypothetical protein
MNIASTCGWLAAATLVIAGCGKSENKPKPGADPKTTTTTEPTTAPAAAKPGVELFTGTAPALPPPIDKLAFGMTSAEAKAAAPAVDLKSSYAVPGYEGAKLRVSVSSKTDRIYAIQVELKQPVDAVKDALTAKWGAPRATKNSIGTAEYYWDKAGVRAKLEPRATASTITFQPSISTEAFLGSTPGRFGFEHTPLLGASREDVLKAYASWSAAVGDTDPDSITISLPALETSEYAGSVRAKLKGDKVTGYTVQVSYSWDPDTKAKLLAGLETLFGKAKAGSMYVDFAGPPKAKVDPSSKDQLVIWVADYK